MPQFIEGPVFRMIVPIPESHAAPSSGGLTEGITEGINEGISEGLKTVLALIQQQPGIQAKAIAKQLDRPRRTIDRQLKLLIDQHYIERIGGRKTGGYRLIKK